MTLTPKELTAKWWEYCNKKHAEPMGTLPFCSNCVEDAIREVVEECKPFMQHKDNCRFPTRLENVTENHVSWCSCGLDEFCKLMEAIDDADV